MVSGLVGTKGTGGFAVLAEIVRVRVLSTGLARFLITCATLVVPVG